MSDFTDDGDERDEQAVEEDEALGEVLGVTDDTDGPATPAVVDPAPAPALGETAVITEDELLEGALGEAGGDEDDEEDQAVRESPYDRPGSWYVVHTYAGYENKVKSNLESRINSMDMEDRIFECVIPMEDVIEFKGGKKVVVQKKVFPGYLLVRCDLDDDSWRVVRNTPGVTGFVGAGSKPTPLTRSDVETFLGVKDEVEGVKPAHRARGSSTKWARACVSARARSPTSRARSPRSTKTS